MTSISVMRDGYEFRVRAEGHATGSAAACAGVSAILYALAGWLENEYPAGDGSPWLRADMREGFAELRFRGGDRAAAAYALAVIGLAQIAKKYPHAVEIKMEEPGQSPAKRV